jgi:oligo-1,6-glucosidase
MIEKYGRDNARTPFQWSAAEHAGFTRGTPWLRVNPNYTEINLENEKDDPDSVYNYYRRLTRLRKSEKYSDTFVYGSLIPYLADMHNVMSYFRKGNDQTLLIMANYQSEPQRLPLPGKVINVLLTNTTRPEITDNEIRLDGYQAVVLEIE